MHLPLAGAGANPKLVQRILGHASHAMTMDLHGHPIENLWDAAAKFRGTRDTDAGFVRERGSPRIDIWCLTWDFAEKGDHRRV